MIGLLRVYFGIEEGDDARRIRQKVTGRLLTLERALEPTLPALLALLEAAGDDPGWAALEASKRRERTLDALKRLILCEAAVQPVLLVVEEALPLLERAVEETTIRRAGGHALRAAHLGEAYLLAGRHEEATALAKRALALSREHRERAHEAYALRLLGEIAVRDAADLDRAALPYREAVALSQTLGMRPLLGQCQLGLGALYLSGGRLDKARAALVVALQLFEEMEMPFWLQRTRAARRAAD